MSKFSILLSSFVVLILVACQTSSSVSVSREKAVATGYVQPESLAVDEKGGYLYISVPGELNGVDGDGMIARTPLGGDFEKEIFVDGLNGPMGIKIVGDTLYAVEVNGVLEIDIPSKELRKIEIPDAGFLLDLAVAPNGDIFLTDAPGNKIFRVSGDDVSVFWNDENLSYPNGIEILPDGKTILIASWGVVTNPNTWETSEGGRITLIDMTSKEISYRSEPLGYLDGTFFWNRHTVLVTDSRTGEIYSFDLKSKASSLLEASGEAGLADLVKFNGSMYGINYNSSNLSYFTVK